MASALGFGEGCGEFVDAVVDIRGQGILPWEFGVAGLGEGLLAGLGTGAGCGLDAGPDRGIVVVIVAADALEVDADFVFFRGPCGCVAVAALAASVFTAELYDGLVAARSEKLEGADEAWVRGKSEFFEGFFNNLFRVGNGERSEIFFGSLVL
jgi:hypothetical protein